MTSEELTRVELQRVAVSQEHTVRLLALVVDRLDQIIARMDEYNTEEPREEYQTL